MNDLVEGCKIDGLIALDGEDIYGNNMDINPAEKKGWYGISEGKSISDEYL